MTTKMTMRAMFLTMIAIGVGAFVSVQAGSLEPPPGPVSATRPPDRCFDNGNRFVDCGNGTVKDTKTGLFWLKDVNCFGAQNWATANISAAGLWGNGQCGLTDGSLPGDWRLPTLGCASGDSCSPIYTGTGEFPSIFGSACSTAPYVLNATGSGCWTAATSPFSGVQSFYYWSSSTLAGIPGLAWEANLSGGTVYNFNKAVTFYVWPVRGGP